jgi:very-short-patch-repair endonuclease
MVEIDGVGHLEVATWHDDLARHNALVAGNGGIVLRVSNWQLLYEPDAFFDVLTPLLMSA